MSRNHRTTTFSNIGFCTKDRVFSKTINRASKCCKQALVYFMVSFENMLLGWSENYCLMFSQLVDLSSVGVRCCNTHQI